MSYKKICALGLVLMTTTLLSACSFTQLELNRQVPTPASVTSEPVVSETSKSLIETIKALAQDGKALGSDFTADASHNISEAYDLLGEPVQPEMWIGDAKGLYSVFDKNYLVFGSNKGGAIFEIRSNDPSLGEIGYQDIVQILGVPDRLNTTADETIIGYKVNDRFKLLFVFPKLNAANDNPVLKHYSVFYPKGTVNSMADDPGREW